jgi:hypothetical protein
MSVGRPVSCFKWFDPSYNETITYQNAYYVGRLKLHDQVIYRDMRSLIPRSIRAFVYGVSNTHYKLKLYKGHDTNEVKYVRLKHSTLMNIKSFKSIILVSDTYDPNIHIPPRWYQRFRIFDLPVDNIVVPNVNPPNHTVLRLEDNEVLEVIHNGQSFTIPVNRIIQNLSQRQNQPPNNSVIKVEEAMSIIDEIKENLTDGQYLQLCNFLMSVKGK